MIVTAGNDSDRNSLNDMITFSFCHFRFALVAFSNACLGNILRFQKKSKIKKKIRIELGFVAFNGNKTMNKVN